MLQWGGIPKVDIRGFSTRELQIDLKPGALHQFGVSVSDVARAVQAGSLDLPAGSLETSTETLLIRVAEERRNVDDLAELIVRSSEQWRAGPAGRYRRDHPSGSPWMMT